MKIVTLNQQLNRVQVAAFEIENQIVFEYFNKLPQAERDHYFQKSLYIGVLALMEDRLSSFLAKTTNELGTELQSLKMIFDMKSELFYKSSIKGAIGEEEIANYLIELVDKLKLGDKLRLTGTTTGALKRNKTGDIISELNSDTKASIVIECKFDKNIRLGDLSVKDIFTKKTDTVWSQLLEAQANRESQTGIIVFDISSIDSSILTVTQDVKYIPTVGFIAVVDTLKGDFKNLAIAYTLARDIVLNTKASNLDHNLLRLLVTRIIKDINEITAIKSLVLSNIDNCKKILTQIEKSMLLMQFNQKYLMKYLQDGTLSKSDLLDFYMGEEIKENYKLLEKDVLQLGTD